MHLPNNTLLQGGKYKIVRFISAGGFGCTYEAEHVLLQKRVAIKEFFVKDFCNRDEETSEVTISNTARVALVNKLKVKFVDEARSLCQLEHPNIVHVYDVFEDNNTAYYVMDYIDGSSLNDIIKRNGAIPEKTALRYIGQVCSALNFVHSKNRLHLDIKPANIMIDEHDNAILIDFGASKQYDEVNGENTSTLLGKTPCYAPLEQMGNSVQIFTPATDIYSLGATLYKMLTGITPPEANILVVDDEKLMSMPSYISIATRNAVEQAMKVKRKDRPQSIDQFLALLFTTVINKDDDEIARKNIHQHDIKEDCLKTQNDAGTKSVNPKLIIILVGVAILTTTVYLGVQNLKNTSPNLDYEEDTTSVSIVEQIPTNVENMMWELPIGTANYTGAVDSVMQPHGKGVATISAGEYSGNIYDGEFVHGTMEGQTVYTLQGGDTFVGTFKQNKYREGRYTISSTGEYFEGVFTDGQPDKGTWFDKNGKKL